MKEVNPLILEAHLIILISIIIFNFCKESVSSLIQGLKPYHPKEDLTAPWSTLPLFLLKHNKLNNPLLLIRSMLYSNIAKVDLYLLAKLN